jgi:hypothetical protein
MVQGSRNVPYAFYLTPLTFYQGIKKALDHQCCNFQPEVLDFIIFFVVFKILIAQFVIIKITCAGIV